MKCPVQAFVALAMFIGGFATKPEAPQTAMTGNLVVRNLTEYTLSVTRIGVPLSHGRGPGGGGERFYPIVYVSPYQTITLTNKDPGIVIGFFADPRRLFETGAHAQRPHQPSLRPDPGGDCSDVEDRPAPHAHPSAARNMT